MRRPYRTIAGLACLALSPWLGTARAEDDERPARPTLSPQSRTTQTNAKRAIGDDSAEGPSILNSVPAFADLASVRDALQDRGLHLYAIYLGDPYANLGGGLKRGATYSGRLDVQLDIDMAAVAGLTGATLHANMYQIHGHDLSHNDVGNLLSINDIAALPTTRLYELWVEQRFGDRLSVRAGQIGIDVEFLTSNYAGTFVNATFGWPGLPSFDLPEGGPAYPLATPAVRLRYEATDQLSILAAVFDGEPAGPGTGDAQARDRYGLNFRVSDPPLVFLEAQFRYNQGPDATGLPGSAKLGAFAHFGRFASAGLGETTTDASTSTPLPYAWNGGLYAVLDQQIYRMPGDEPQKGIGVFARAIGAPSDRNLIDIYGDAGVVGLGLIPGRPADAIGLAAAVAVISPSVQTPENDGVVAYDAVAKPKDFEAVIEATYEAQVIPGLMLQPTFQYIIHPGGGTDNGSRPIHDAKVFGVTTTVRF